MNILWNYAIFHGKGNNIDSFDHNFVLMEIRPKVHLVVINLICKIILLVPDWRALSVLFFVKSYFFLVFDIIFFLGRVPPRLPREYGWPIPEKLLQWNFFRRRNLETSEEDLEAGLSRQPSQHRDWNSFSRKNFVKLVF